MPEVTLLMVHGGWLDGYRTARTSWAQSPLNRDRTDLPLIAMAFIPTHSIGIMHLYYLGTHYFLLGGSRHLFKTKLNLYRLVHSPIWAKNLSTDLAA